MRCAEGKRGKERGRETEGERERGREGGRGRGDVFCFFVFVSSALVSSGLKLRNCYPLQLSVSIPDYYYYYHSSSSAAAASLEGAELSARVWSVDPSVSYARRHSRARTCENCVGIVAA